MSRNLKNRNLKMKCLRPLAGLLATGLSIPAFAQSVPFPTYTTGAQPDGSFVVSDGQIITPAGKQVDLGIRVRAKAVALNPNKKSHTAAVLTMGSTQAVEIFDTRTGDVLQNYITLGQDSSGSYSGISYSRDGKHLAFSQDSGNGNVTIADVSEEGLLSDNAEVMVPPSSAFINCYPNSNPGSYNTPCGSLWGGESYPGGVAFSHDGKVVYAVANLNDTLAKIDLSGSTPTFVKQIGVGVAPHSIIITPDGKTAYISNEGGRPATEADFQIYSGGAEVVADPVIGAAVTGTVSVVDLATMKVTASIETGLHPTGMALYGTELWVANTYSDTISVIDVTTSKVKRTINLGLPIGIPGSGQAAYGAAPVSIALDAESGVAYVALYNANAVAVVSLHPVTNPVLGMIPVAYAPSSVVHDSADNSLIVANDKGVGTLYSFETDHGVTGLNSHQDHGTVSVVPLPNAKTLKAMTKQVFENNHWDLAQNIQSSTGGSQDTKAVALPAKIGDPSTIKHVFLIVRENRTYDQILGDVAKGNGDPSLAVFGGKDTPNVHQLVKRFPLFDNFYDPSRQSADGHQWITEGLAPYADDIQSPDWNRSYAGGNAGDALVYQKKGFLFSEASAAGLPVKMYGEYVENNTFVQPNGSTSEPSWSQFYTDALNFESGKEKTLYYQNTVNAYSSLPAVADHLVKNFPQFDTAIPDQFRVDIWQQDFKNDVANGSVPALSILWVPDDHTGGPPTPDAQQADNDLAVGRIVDYISHSNVWSSSAIFIEEDDAQNGVDHVDGHRSPGYIVSPYVKQNASASDSTYYTQVNMTRTIEQILGLPPMNQFDLVASPMRTAFVEGEVPSENFKPWNHVANEVPLDQGVTKTASLQSSSTAVKALQTAWLKKKAAIFAGKQNKPDSEDPDTVNHLNWYMSTGFTKPYPGEKKVRFPSEFNNPAPKTADLDD